MAIHHASNGVKILGLDIYVVFPFLAWGPIQTQEMFYFAVIVALALSWTSYKRETVDTLIRRLRTLFIEKYRFIRSPARKI